MAISDTQKVDLLWKKVGFSKTKSDTNANKKAPNDMIVWVIGDSFLSVIKPYIDASFKEVKYKDNLYEGHMSHKIKTLPSELVNSNEKPDLIIVVKVERSF